MHLHLRFVYEGFDGPAPATVGSMEENKEVGISGNFMPNHLSPVYKTNDRQREWYC